MSRYENRLLKTLGAVSAGLLLCVLLSSCAARSVIGADLHLTTADPELQSLVKLARTGDKPAQFELGQRYEEGRGVPVNLSAARLLYEAAAANSGEGVPVWAPGVGDAPGRVVFLESGIKSPGLPAAQQRLKTMDAKVARDGGDRP
jgi:hypothetical protein